jgi:hypothetical protein
MTENSGPTGSSSRPVSHGRCCCQPLVDADFAAPAALTAPNEQRAAAMVEVGLVERGRFVDAQAGTPQHHDKTRSLRP